MGGGGVGAVGGERTETDVALALTGVFLELADCQQSVIFPLGAGVALERESIVFRANLIFLSRKFKKKLKF